MFLFCVPAVTWTNEGPATPHTFLPTFSPPHFPSKHTPSSPQRLSFTPMSPLLLSDLLSAVRHQLAPAFTINISMQQPINAIWAWGAGRAPPYHWCHQINSGMEALVLVRRRLILSETLHHLLPPLTRSSPALNYITANHQLFYIILF